MVPVVPPVGGGDSDRSRSSMDGGSSHGSGLLAGFRRTTSGSGGAPRRPSGMVRKSTSNIRLRTQPTMARSPTARLRHAVFRGNLPDDGSRLVLLNDVAANKKHDYCSNELRTTKYTWLNLIPKALFEQFRRIANFYFLFVAIISYIPNVSPTNPAANVLPLLVVVGFGYARDVYEDLKRRRLDSRINLARFIILRRTAAGTGTPFAAASSSGDVTAFSTVGTTPAPAPADRHDGVGGGGAGGLLGAKSLEKDDVAALERAHLPADAHASVASKKIAVGDIVWIRKGETFPADMVLLVSSGDGGVAFVSTANLDGESNLKRHVVAASAAHLRGGDALRHVAGGCHAQAPAAAFHSFRGSLAVGTGDPAPLDASNLLLRGSVLRNTDWIYGLAVYTGPESKIALNMRNPPSKMGPIEVKLNWIVGILFIFLALVVIVSAVVSGTLQGVKSDGQWYMGEKRLVTGVKTTFIGLGTFLVLFSTWIPISLFVTLEFVRVIQAAFMQNDIHLTSRGHTIAAKATNLNEMLGNIEHVLSDKTGTLTENEMNYVACSAGNRIIDIRGDPMAMQTAVANGDASARSLIVAMALCHAVVPEPVADEPAATKDASSSKRKLLSGFSKDMTSEVASSVSDVDSSPAQAGCANGKAGAADRVVEYQGQSPDEVALVTSARSFGVELLDRSLDTLTVREFGTVKKYTMLGELEFDSDRKRMSMVLRDPSGDVLVICKGADTVMLPLLAPPDDPSDAGHAALQEHIDVFAKEGLRTLVFAQKRLSADEYTEWAKQFDAARNSLEERDSLTEAAAAVVETNMTLIACTAVEDRLGTDVPETIAFLRAAGVRLWVLTGDKRETAENIGYSSNLLDNNMTVIHLKEDSPDGIQLALNHAIQVHVKGDLDEGGQDGPVPEAGMLRRARSRLRRGQDAKEVELGIIIDGATLGHALEAHAELLMELSDACKTVICCRVTPLQKALVVRMVRELRKTNTLAIGDGGNDVSMIQEAHVGVGIYGKEGSQAARASDYAISEFRHLQRLLTIHGRYSYVRTAGVIALSLYKNASFTLTQFLFQIWCFWSGTTFNDQWMVSTFNVLITAWTPLFFGTFERDLTEETLRNHPEVYLSYRKNRLFNTWTVAEYVLGYGLWHALCVYFGLYLSIGYLGAPYANGQGGGFYFIGLANTFTIILVTFAKMTLMSHLINWFVIFGLLFGISTFFWLMPILTSPVVGEYPLEGLVLQLFRSSAYWLTAAVIIAACFLLDFSVLVIRQLVYPTLVSRLQLQEKREERKSGGPRLWPPCP